MKNAKSSARSTAYKLSRRVFSLDVSWTEKLVLLALADRANDDGSSCDPSVLTLARKTSLSRRTVQRTLSKLKEKRLVVVCEGNHAYWLDIERLKELQRFPKPEVRP
jgi:DNA-binding MarR family transcriptional regulator